MSLTDGLSWPQPEQRDKASTITTMGTIWRIGVWPRFSLRAFPGWQLFMSILQSIPMGPSVGLDYGDTQDGYRQSPSLP